MTVKTEGDLGRTLFISLNELRVGLRVWEDETLDLDRGDACFMSMVWVLISASRFQFC